jgi:hypothetical protein
VVESVLALNNDPPLSISTRRQLFLSSSGAALGVLLMPGSSSLSIANAEDKLVFHTLEDGLRVADIRNGIGMMEVQADSKVNIHLTGRLLGKNGWIFMNSQLDDEPYRLQLGVGTVVSGLEEGLMAMKEGGRRRIVVPSALGYLDKTLEPIPRDFGNRQRLYTTVMNRGRIDREKSQLGTDLAGMVVFDVELLRIRN